MIKFYDITKSELDSKAFEAEALYYCTDTKSIYIDSVNSGERESMAQNAIILNRESEKPLAPIPGKLYCVLETGLVYTYVNGNWKCLSPRKLYFEDITVSGGTATVTNSSILANDKAIFLVDPSVKDLASGVSAVCTAGKCTITLTSDYDIFGTLIVESGNIEIVS